MDVAFIVWLVIGISLIVAEVFVPGLVLVFFGLGALTVAGALYAGLLSSIGASLWLWLGSSFVYALSLRWSLKRFLPGTVERRQLKDESVDAFGEVVDVVETIRAGETGGRIRFRGSTWPATCVEGVIEKGQRAVLLYKEGLGWMVEPAGEGLIELPPGPAGEPSP